MTSLPALALLLLTSSWSVQAATHRSLAGSHSTTTTTTSADHTADGSAPPPPGRLARASSDDPPLAAKAAVREGEEAPALGETTLMIAESGEAKVAAFVGVTAPAPSGRTEAQQTKSAGGTDPQAENVPRHHVPPRAESLGNVGKRAQTLETGVAKPDETKHGRKTDQQTSSVKLNLETTPSIELRGNDVKRVETDSERETLQRKNASETPRVQLNLEVTPRTASRGNESAKGKQVQATMANAEEEDDRDYSDPSVAAAEEEEAEAAGGGGGGGGGGGLLGAAGVRLQRLLGAAQEAAEALAEVPRQILLLPIRFGFYPGLTRQQEEIPRLAPFPCAGVARAWRDTDVPSSVHRLRPGDVRVVAALGDSLTAANGALAYTEEETRLDYRGVSAYGGGQGTWREYLTLPNVLKEFNPKLQGYAVGLAGGAEADGERAGLNLARNGALDDELAAQARRLVARLHKHPFVDVRRDWKLVTVLIGGNDLCNEYCYSEGGRHSAQGHARALRAALDILREHLPRTFVALVHIPDLLQLRNMRNVPFACHLKQLVLCSCLFGGAERAKAESVGRMLRGYWEAEREVAEDPRYDAEDFTVALQPFFLGVEFPAAVHTWFGEAPDLSYFAPDCFHFSQKGNALAANALWNNLLQPEGRKALGWRPLMERFLCPNDSAPFLFTRRNSRTFLETGRQY